VGARDSCAELADVADEVVCPFMPEPFQAVGLWYHNMTQASDEEVCHLLKLAWSEHAQELRLALQSRRAASQAVPAQAPAVPAAPPVLP